MKPISENIPSDPQLDAAAAGVLPARKMLTLDVGPVISLSFWVFLGWIVGAVAVVCVFAAAIVWFWVPDRAWSVLPAGAAVVMAQGAGMLAARPWKKRHLGRWPMAWLAGRGVSFLGVFAAGALLYSATRPDPLVFGLVTAGAYFVSLLAEVWAYSLQVKESAGGGVSSSVSGG